MELSLKDKVALVTGANDGIGRAAAELFLANGARVGMLDIAEDELRKTVKDLTRDGGQAMPLVADVSKPDQVERATRELFDRWGRLDVVFANAGVNGVWAPVDELEVDEWQKTLGINLSGTFYTIKYAVPYMKERGGSIVVTASVNGTRMFSNSGATAYASSKAGQVALTKMLALELAPHRIRVNVICPGMIATDISERTDKEDLKGIGWPVEYPRGKVPLTGGGPGQARDVAQLVLFLASDASSHVSGTEIWIDGAESLIQG